MPYYPRMPQQQGSGFYNPYMKGPDIGQGVNQMLAQFAARQQQKRDEEKEEKRRKFVESLELKKIENEAKRIRVAEENAASLGRYRDVQISEIAKGEKKVQYPESTISGVSEMFGVTREEWDRLPSSEQGKYANSYLIEKRQQLGKEPIVISQRQRADTAWADNIHGSLARAITSRQAITDADTMYGEEVGPDVEMERLNVLMEELSRLRSVLISREWSDNERKRAGQIMSEIFMVQKKQEAAEPMGFLRRAFNIPGAAMKEAVTMKPGAMRRIEEGENKGTWQYISEELGWRKIG